MSRTGDLAHQAYEALLAQIASRRLLPGERLLEAEIAQQLDMSRTPVQYALRMLTARGLVHRRANCGCVIAKANLSDLPQLYEVRETLEVLAVRTMTTSASDEDVAKLRASADALSAAAAMDDAADFGLHDLEFHQQLIRHCGNRFIAEVANADALILRTFLASWPTGRAPFHVRFTHEDVAVAIEARDPDAAEAALRRHIREPVEWARRHVEREQAEKSAASGGVDSQSCRSPV